MFPVTLAWEIIRSTVEKNSHFLRSRLWCSRRRKQMEADERGPSNHVLLFSISSNLALPLKEASRVSYFQNCLLPRCSVTSKGDYIYLKSKLSLACDFISYLPWATPNVGMCDAVECPQLRGASPRGMVLRSCFCCVFIGCCVVAPRFPWRAESRCPLHKVKVRNLERDVGQAHPVQKARLDTTALEEGKWLWQALTTLRSGVFA